MASSEPLRLAAAAAASAQERSTRPARNADWRSRPQTPRAAPQSLRHRVELIRDTVLTRQDTADALATLANASAPGGMMACSQMAGVHGTLDLEIGGTRGSYRPTACAAALRPLPTNAAWRLRHATCLLSVARADQPRPQGVTRSAGELPEVDHVRHHVRLDAERRQHLPQKRRQDDESTQWRMTRRATADRRRWSGASPL